MAYHPHPRKKAPRHPTFEAVVAIMAVVTPLMTLPQVYLIYANKSADGVSALTWSAYVFSAVIWLTYGMIHQEKPIILNSIIGGILSLCVLAGAILF